MTGAAWLTQTRCREPCVHREPAERTAFILPFKELIPQGVSDAKLTQQTHAFHIRPSTIDAGGSDRLFEMIVIAPKSDRFGNAYAYLLLSLILSTNIVYNYHTIDFSIFYYFVLLKLRSETYSKQTYNKYDRYTYAINITYRYTYKQYIQNLFLPPWENVWT